MPESPEVKVIAEQLKSKFVGKQLKSIQQIGGRFSKSPESSLETLSKICSARQNVKIQNIGSKGKLLYFKFDEDAYLLNTLGMTGTWSETPSKWDAVKLQFEDDKELYFQDIRHFGTLKFVSHTEYIKKIYSLGIDPLKETIHQSELIKLEASNQTLAQLLMRQDIIAGIGNYLKCEILYQAKLSPWRKGNALTTQEFYALLDAINEIPKKSYQMQEASFKTYKHMEGEGNFSSFFKVYGKERDPLGNSIKKETTLDKRTSWWVPQLQK